WVRFTRRQPPRHFFFPSNICGLAKEGQRHSGWVQRAWHLAHYDRAQLRVFPLRWENEKVNYFSPPW
ncbi:hypothetical protein PVMG_01059, partial [Plasmodium vivax Mauritania I]